MRYFLVLAFSLLSVTAAQPTLSEQLAAGALDWQSVQQQARAEGTVRWYHWGGAEDLNLWIDQVVAPAMAAQGIRLQTVRLADTREAVELVLSELSQDETTAGSVDAIWINGENFLSLASQDALLGAFADKLPNSRYFLWDDTAAAAINRYDNGYPTGLQEVPWASFEYVCIIDSQRLSPEDAPRDFVELMHWLKSDPGRFSYVRPPNYIGNAFVMQALYAHSPNGFRDFQQPLSNHSPAQLTAILVDGMQYLRDLSPWLLGGSGKAGVFGGTIYPESEAANEVFFNNGEVDMQCQFGAFSAAVGIDNGAYPATARTIDFPRSGMIANKSFITIPRNAPNPAAALVLANHLSSVENQVSKLAVLGYAPGVDTPLLSASQRADIVQAAPPLMGLDLETLAARRVPEAHSSLVAVIERVWEAYVLENSAESLETLVTRALQAAQ